MLEFLFGFYWQFHRKIVSFIENVQLYEERKPEHSNRSKEQTNCFYLSVQSLSISHVRQKPDQCMFKINTRKIFLYIHLCIYFRRYVHCIFVSKLIRAIRPTVSQIPSLSTRFFTFVLPSRGNAWKYFKRRRTYSISGVSIVRCIFRCIHKSINEWKYLLDRSGSMSNDQFVKHT